ncbi:MAG: TetR/AcrR family transcriptional regulator [Myxococcota bacterium]
MAQDGISEARKRVLDVAGQLFSERGYAAVTLKDVARALGVKQAALYYHAPGGKEELFIAVTEHTLNRHRVGLTAALTDAEPRLTHQLRAAAAWMLSQPPLDLSRFLRADLPALSGDNAQRLHDLAHESLNAPLEDALQQAYQRGETRRFDPRTLTVMLLAALNAVHEMKTPDGLPLEVVANDIIDILLDGVRR